MTCYLLLFDAVHETFRSRQSSVGDSCFDTRLEILLFDFEADKEPLHCIVIRKER